MVRIDRTAKCTQMIVLTLDEAIDLMANLGNAIRMRKTRHENRMAHKKLSPKFAPRPDEDPHYHVHCFTNEKPERVIFINLCDIEEEDLDASHG